MADTAKDETLAALISDLSLAADCVWRINSAASQRIRAHIETLRNGGDRAQIVAWLRLHGTEAEPSNFDWLGDPPAFFADAIEAGLDLQAKR